MGATTSKASPSGLGSDFNPRSRMGATTNISYAKRGAYWYFNPRSRMGATSFTGLQAVQQSISIHAPVWERLSHRGRWSGRTDFNPRSRMGATDAIVSAMTLREISIHAPVWERPCVARCSVTDMRISIHAPVWERHLEREGADVASNISIHAPVWERPGIPG